LIHKNDRQKTIKGVSFLLGAYAYIQPILQHSKRDLTLLTEILEEIEQAAAGEQLSAEMSSLVVDCTYQLAFGYYRLGNNTTAKKYLNKLLEMKPGSTKAKALLTLISDTSSSFAKTGFLFATATVIAAFVGYRYYLTTKSK
jgi:predicted PurR-regulated permease PerM